MIARDALRSFASRIERVDDDIKALNADKKAIYEDMRGQGFDVKAFKTAHRRHAAHTKNDVTALATENLADLYFVALQGGEGAETHSGANVAQLRGHPDVPSRARAEDAPAHDPETGEITDTEPAVNRQPLGTAAAAGEGASVDAAAPAATNSEPNISTAPGLDDGTDTAAVDQQSPAAATTPETPPSNVPRIAAGQVADAVHAGAASVTDQSADLEIPAFLRRVKPGDAHGFRNSNVRSGFGPDASPALQTEVA